MREPPSDAHGQVWGENLEIPAGRPPRGVYMRIDAAGKNERLCASFWHRLGIERRKPWAHEELRGTLKLSVYDGAQTVNQIWPSFALWVGGELSANARRQSVMSAQMASNGYGRQTPQKQSQVGHTDPLFTFRSRATPAGEWLRKSLDGPSWLRRRQALARDELNNQVATVLSHELRNSLCVIRMSMEILKMDLSATPTVDKARALIEHQTAHMSRLVEDLLDTSRARNGHLALKCEKVNLCVVAAQALQSVECTMQRSNHRVTVSSPAEPLWLQGDPARLEQIFVNLLLNAAKYTPAGGDIRLSTEQEEGEAVVRIRDNGIGIAPHLLPHVFDLYVQADPASCHSRAGLGIGLALVRNLVDRHGGCVRAASLGLGHGSEFVVRLPMSD